MNIYEVTGTVPGARLVINNIHAENEAKAKKEAKKGIALPFKIIEVKQTGVVTEVTV